MDLYRFATDFSDSGVWMLATCGGLWQKAVAPIQYHARFLGLAGWQDGVWLDGWLDGWMAGWLDGWMELVGTTAVT